MEKKEQRNPEKAKRTVDAFGYILLFTTVAIAIVDLWSHTNGTAIGLANLDRRKLLTEIIGPTARNIGNFGFTAILTALAVFTKHLIIGLSNKETSRGSAQVFFIATMASIMALNASVEDTESSNPEGLTDFVVALISQVASFGSAEFLTSKIKRIFKK